jgi:rod shape-determining protein MreB
MDGAISQHMKRVYNLMIGERTSEEIKLKIGSAYPVDEEDFMEVKGRDLISGLPKMIKISRSEIRTALQEPITNIIETVRMTLERCPPELAADLIDKGIMLAGGGALLRGIDRLIAEETGLPVFVAEDPLKAVANGTGVVLQEIETMSKAIANTSK